MGIPYQQREQKGTGEEEHCHDGDGGGHDTAGEEYAALPHPELIPPPPPAQTRIHSRLKFTFMF
jgi:hypothetical protein